MAVEKREQVFVSSTYVDLLAERQEVIQTLLEADCIPAGMELFPASDDDRWSLIQRIIDDCDYYLVVVGGRYGSIDPERGLSYTEMEFDYAQSKKKPTLGFLHGSPGQIPSDKTELDPEARAKLEAFRAKVEQRIVKFWTSPQELGGQVAKALIQIRKSHPAEGWVRARDALTPEVETELATLRAKVAELTAELSEQRLPLQESLHELAQGDDEYLMFCQIHYWDKEDAAAGRRTSANQKINYEHFPVTWNRIFAKLGPLLLDEASESALDEALDDLALELAVDAEIDEKEPYGSIQSVAADVDVIHDVKVQLFAIGLIERSERRRAVSDQNTYWRLSSAGRDQLMRLRAIRKKRKQIDAVPEGPEAGATCLG